MDQFRPFLRTFFQDFYHIDMNDTTNEIIPTFEETLGIIEAAIENEQTFGKNYDLPKLRMIRTALILAMGTAIEQSTLNNKHTHHRLLQKLFPTGRYHEKEFSFISFNYDLLLDKALMDILDRDIYVDYGIPFTNETIYSKPFEQWESPLGKKRITYLKPHGSFNWLCCPTCHSMYITGVKESRIFSTGYLHNVEHCLKDQSELSYVMQPPTLYMNMKRHIYLQLIWKHTYDTLAEADVIIFIGYALKNADIWLKYILKKSQIHKQKQFHIINPTEESELKPQFERLLGPIQFHQQNFSEFVDRLQQIIHID
jgi:NAD-dependent SIR2 family protein deacetylase